MEKELLKIVDSLEAEGVNLCQQLVRINTVNPYSGDPKAQGELAGQKFLEAKLQEIGVKTRLFEPPSDIYEQAGILGPKDREFSGRPNLVGEKVFGSGGKRIILNSHMDTVGTQAMAIEPFSGQLMDGRIWGRGSSDSKGGLVTAFLAMKALTIFAESHPLKGEIIFQSVVDEECSGSGAGTLACCLEGYIGDFALVVDGAYMGIAPGCTGVVTADIVVRGLSGHGATGGISAIDKAILVKTAIDQFKGQRLEENPGALVNLGVFYAGTHAAVVPGEALLSVNIVYTQKEASKEGDGRNLRDEFQEKIRQAESRDDWLASNPSQITWVKDLPPFSTSEDHPIVFDLAKAFNRVLSRPAPFRRNQAWGDASHLSRIGGMPTVMFGPATQGVAHGPQEYIQVDDIIDAAKVIALFLYQQFSN